MSRFEKFTLGFMGVTAIGLMFHDHMIAKLVKNQNGIIKGVEGVMQVLDSSIQEDVDRIFEDIVDHYDD